MKTTTETCRVEGCEKPRAKVGGKSNGYRSICGGHASRKYRLGDYGTEPLNTPAPAGSGTDCHGYIVDYLPQHPLADGRGRVFRHRHVLYAALDGQDATCHWCPKPVFWKAQEGQERLEADHLDHVKTNNAPENLVPSCHGCNFSRAVNRRVSNGTT